MAAATPEAVRAEVMAWMKATGNGARKAAAQFPGVSENTINSWMRRAGAQRGVRAPISAPIGKGGAKRSEDETGKAGTKDRKQEAGPRARGGANADLPAAPQLVRAGRIAVAQRMLWLASPASLTHKDQLKVAMAMKTTIEAMPGVLLQAMDGTAVDQETMEAELAAAMGVSPEELRRPTLREIPGGKQAGEG